MELGNKKIKYSANLAVVVGLALSSLLMPWLLMGNAGAAQVTTRSITMQDSALGATTTQYEVAFQVATDITIKGVVVEFCDDSPLPAVACDIADNSGTVVPTITSVATPLANLSDTTSLTGTWSGATANSAHTYKLTDNTGNAVTSGDVPLVRFKFVATNPTSTAGTSGHTFYARIYTYTTVAAAATDHTGGVTTGAYTDQGGIALSTANQISITTRVQEQLTFCVQKGATTGCTGGGAPTLEIGAGTPKVIDSSGVYTDTAVFALATNASNGATVRMRGNTLNSGSNVIAPVGAAVQAISAGTENFGMKIAPGSGITGDSNYWEAGLTEYGFDLAETFTATTGYGDRIAYTATPIGTAGPVDSTLTFGATSALTTPAGLYQTTLDLIATGTY